VSADVLVLLGTVLVVAAVAVPLARRLPPQASAWALLGAAAAAAGGWIGALALVAFTGLGQWQPVATLGQWSARWLRAQDPIGSALTMVGTGVLGIASCSLAMTAGHRIRLLARARREHRRLPGAGEIALIDSARPEAFALPGRPGRVVVTTGMLRVLDQTERAALLAHERVHLRRRHHLHLLVTQLSAAACPLLIPTAREMVFVVERWADEEAAAATGDRSTVARAVARAALATNRAHGPSRPLAATGGPVPRRVAALLAPPPRLRGLPLLAFAALLAVCCASLADATGDTDHLFVQARSVHAAHVHERSAQPPHR
jgi:Zn-dependent protease with chaperone function